MVFPSRFTADRLMEWSIRTRECGAGLTSLRDDHVHVLERIRREEEPGPLLEDRIANVTSSLERLEVGVAESGVILALSSPFDFLPPALTSAMRNYVFHGEVGCTGDVPSWWNQLITMDKCATKSVANTCPRRTCFSQSIISEVLSTLVAFYYRIGRSRVDSRRGLSRESSRWESRRAKSTSEGRVSQHPSLSYALTFNFRFRKNFPWRSGRMWRQSKVQRASQRPFLGSLTVPETYAPAAVTHNPFSLIIPLARTFLFSHNPFRWKSGKVHTVVCKSAIQLILCFEFEA